MSEKCGSARNWTWVFRLLIECLNHSATEPTMLATRLIIDLNVVRSMHRLRNNVLNSWKLRWTQGFLLIGRLIGMVDIFLCIWLQHVLDRRHWGTVGGALFSGTLRQVLCVALIPPAAVDSCCVTELLAWGQVHLGRPGLHLDWLDVPVDACWSRVRSCATEGTEWHSHEYELQACNSSSSSRLECCVWHSRPWYLACSS